MFSGIKAILKEFKKRQDAESQKNLVYSQEETDTGKTWIDGKKIYRKVYQLGQLPNNTKKEIPADFSNIENIINMFSQASSSIENTSISLPFINADGSIVSVYKNLDGFVLATNVDASQYDKSFVILEYTKTTS